MAIGNVLACVCCSLFTLWHEHKAFLWPLVSGLLILDKSANCLLFPFSFMEVEKTLQKARCVLQPFWEGEMEAWRSAVIYHGNLKGIHVKVDSSATNLSNKGKETNRRFRRKQGKSPAAYWHLLEKALPCSWWGATDANYRVIKPGWYFNSNLNASGRQRAAYCLWHSLGCGWGAPARGKRGLWAASCSQGKGCGVPLPRKLGHRLWILRSVSDHGLLENLLFFFFFFLEKSCYA